MQFGFNSIEFVIYFTVFTMLYYAVKGIYRKTILALGSLLFYFLISKYFIVVLGYYIIVTFIFSKIIEVNKPGKFRIALPLGIFFLLIPLVLFKYTDFYGEIIKNITVLIGWNYGSEILKFAVPVGISFYSFKSISFLVEKSRNSLPGLDSLFNIILYLSYFPAVISGPIDRPQKLLTAIDKEKSFIYEKITDGMKIVIWGYFNKLVIADRISPITGKIFSNIQDYDSLSLLLGIILFTVQIYCDFAGYSYVALGLSRVLGIEIINNFRRPYFSKSISEFWTRWHISLSLWFRDYLFLPMTVFLSRTTALKRITHGHYKLFDILIYCTVTMITMSACGIWHGSGANFLLWGVYLGVLLSMSAILRKQRKALIKILRIKKESPLRKVFGIALTTFSVSVSWVIFKTYSINDSVLFFSRIVTGWKRTFQQIIDLGIDKHTIQILGITHKDFYSLIVFIPLLFLVDYLQERYNLFELLKEKSVFIRWTLYYGAVLAVAFFGAFNSIQGFIYQQF